MFVLFDSVRGETLKPLSQELVTGLFNLLDQPGSTENEYVMKAIMRSFGVLQDGVIPFLNTALEKLTQKLIVVARFVVFYYDQINVII